jgi:hypothetical protein
MKQAGSTDIMSVRQTGILPVFFVPMNHEKSRE